LSQNKTETEMATYQLGEVISAQNRAYQTAEYKWRKNVSAVAGKLPADKPSSDR